MRRPYLTDNTGRRREVRRPDPFPLAAGTRCPGPAGLRWPEDRATDAQMPEPTPGLTPSWIGAILVAALACGAAGAAQDTGAQASQVWTFDRLDRLGGHQTTVLGGPRVVDTPVGKAIEFDGVDDALVVDVHPLEGARTFTWEAIFRPDGGDREQRWFHLQETGSENRMLFEIRVAGDRWYLDSFNFSTTGTATLMNRSSLHPLGAWYHVAAVYDGKVFSNYVNGVRDGQAEVELSPQGSGRSSIGVRINMVNYFKGAIHLARFTRRALSPDEFLKVPPAGVKPPEAAARASRPRSGSLSGAGQ